MVAQGLAQLRIGTKSLSGFSFKQVGFWFIHPLSFGSSPPLSRLFRPHSSPSTSLPDCAPNSFRWVSMILYVMIHFWLSACADLMKNHLKYNFRLLLVVLLWCEDRLTLGRDLALVELGEETNMHYNLPHCLLFMHGVIFQLRKSVSGQLCCARFPRLRPFILETMGWCNMYLAGIVWPYGRSFGFDSLAFHFRQLYHQWWPTQNV